MPDSSFRRMTAEETYRRNFLPLYPRLFNAAYALLANEDDAADIVQDTMVKLWNQRDMLSEVKSPTAFALTMLRNIAIDTLRNQKPTEQPEDNLVYHIPEEPDTETFIRHAINTLPDAQREVITLSAFGRLSGKEIAELTGLSADNVRQLLCRARRKLREIYSKHI
ncbi:MAG: RNA polymerase sigma factor [Bacteroidales bacterium]|nr:RNA polymerase sigma factor [Bacteroidales bacterium]